VATDRKLSLPLVLDMLAKSDGARPTLEVARRRLGGRGKSGPGAGRIVGVRATRALPQTVGVVLFETESACDVWIEAGVVRRTDRVATTPFEGDVPAELERMAVDVRVFVLLEERQNVRYEVAGEVREGTLIEKCRYGALVATPDGRILAVGFRKLWPVTPSELAS
jgi:hypothetical protein